jgi:hypothetical protein
MIYPMFRQTQILLQSKFANSGAPPGSVHKFDASEPDRREASQLGGEGLKPATAAGISMSHRLERRCPKAEMDDILGVLVQNWQGCLLWAFPILFWMIGSTRDWLECLLEFKLPSTGSEVLLCQQNVRSDSRSCKDSQLRPVDQSLHNRPISFFRGMMMRIYSCTVYCIYCAYMYIHI